MKTVSEAAPVASENQIRPKIIDPDTSRAITGVRFVLMVFVVFIHNVVREVNFASGTVAVAVPAAADFTRTLISGFLGAAAVPTFFFISGYILFFKDERYSVMMRKKCRSVLLPYFLWNALIAAAFAVCQRIPALRQYFATIIISDLDWKGWIGLFAGRASKGAEGLYPPLVYQFWFLRELFFCAALSPLIRFLTKKTPLLYGVFLVIMLNSEWLYGGFRTALFYFSLGAFAVRFGLSYKNLERIQFFDIGILYALILLLRFYFYFSGRPEFAGTGTASVMTGGLLLLKISGAVCKSEKRFSFLKYLAGLSFWLYATHDPFLITPIKKLWVRFIPIDGWRLFPEYFGAVFLCVAVSLAAGIILRKIAPKLFSLLTGGRA